MDKNEAVVKIVTRVSAFILGIVAVSEVSELVKSKIK